MWLLYMLSLSLGDDCNDGLQSPIDISDPFYYQDPNIQFSLGYQEDTLLYDDGYNLRIDGDFGYFLWAGSSFWSYQILFKMPSEHTLEGEHLPMEMQIYYVDQYGNLAAMAAFFNNTVESNFLSQIGFGNPMLRDAGSGSLFKIQDPVDLEILLGYPETYLYYTGSTTISPCETNVTWIILTDIYDASSDQLSNFPTSLVNVTRSTQPLNGRKIYTNFQDTQNTSGDQESSDDDESLIQKISYGESYKDVDDDFIIDSDSYQSQFPQVSSIYAIN